MTGERDINEDLKPSAGDYTHAGVRAGLSTAPFLGGPLAEFFAMVIAPPLEQRRDAWLVEIFTRLKKLEEEIKEFKIENLKQNEVFISTLFYATQIAMRTHQDPKLEALKNAVINSVRNPDIDESLQLMFLNFVDRYTPWHLAILQYLNDPRKYRKRHGIKSLPIEYDQKKKKIIIEKIFPELKNKRKFYDQIGRDLYYDGMLDEDIYLHEMTTMAGWDGSLTTELGKQFLNFINNSIDR